MTEEDLKRGRKLSDQIQRYKYLMESFDQSKEIGTPIQVGNTVVVTNRIRKIIRRKYEAKVHVF